MSVRRKTITLKDYSVVGVDFHTENDVRLRVVVPAGSHGLVLVHGSAPQATLDMHCTVARNATVHIVTIVTNVRKFNGTMDIDLVGKGAEATVSGMYHGCNEDQHSFYGTMNHKVRHTKGDILIRGVYEKESRGFFSGLIKIDKTAQQTLSYFTDNILLLDNARATSVPTLEIEANDVKASHGSTTGRIDDDKLFYLTSRGVTEQQARQMVIGGFFKPIIDRLQLTTIPA